MYHRQKLLNLINRGSLRLLSICILSVVRYFKEHDVSKTGFRIRFQVKPTYLGPIDRPSPYLRTTGRFYFEPTFATPF
jgi:hypothetical protein